MSIYHLSLSNSDASTFPTKTVAEGFRKVAERTFPGRRYTLARRGPARNGGWIVRASMLSGVTSAGAPLRLVVTEFPTADASAWFRERGPQTVREASAWYLRHFDAPRGDRIRNALTIHDVKRIHETKFPDSHFFDPEALKFFGQTLASFRVTIADKRAGTYNVVAPMKDRDGRRTGSTRRIFDRATGELRHVVKEGA